DRKARRCGKCQGDRRGSGSRPELAGARKRRHQDAQGLRSASPKVLETVGRHFGVPDRVLDVLVPEVRVDREWHVWPPCQGCKGVRKNPAEVPFRKCNKFNARSSQKCCMR